MHVVRQPARHKFATREEYALEFLSRTWKRRLPRQREGCTVLRLMENGDEVSMIVEAPESQMEARIARLESDVEHIRTDIVDVKTDIRALRGKMDDMNTSLSDRIDDVNRTLTAKIDDVNRTLAAKIDDVNRTLTAKIDDVNRTLTTKIDDLKDGLASAKIWALVLYIAFAGTMFGTLARGFGWI